MAVSAEREPLDPGEFELRLLDPADSRCWQPPSVNLVEAAPGPSAEVAQPHYEEALRRGLSEGRARGEAEFKDRCRQLSDLIDSLSQPLAALDSQMEETLAELTFHLASQLCQHSLRTRPEQIVELVKAGIAELPMSRQGIRILLNPEDARLISDSCGTEPGWRIVEDPAIRRGGCQINTETSAIDLRLETRLARLVEQFFADDVPASLAGGERE